jgi:hypothetical protein
LHRVDGPLFSLGLCCIFDPCPCFFFTIVKLCKATFCSQVWYLKCYLKNNAISTLG